MLRYLNVRNSFGVETVDEINSEDFNNNSDFRKEIKRLVGEYHMAGINVYTSQRCSITWKNK